MKIRLATSNDIAAIQDLSQELFEFERPLNQTFNMTWSHAKEGKEYFTKCITDPYNFILVAEENKKLIGYISAEITNFAWRSVNPVAEIINLIITENQRTKGIGTELVEGFKKECRTRGIRRLRVQHLFGNDRALQFYKKHGFTDFSSTLEQDCI